MKHFPQDSAAPPENASLLESGQGHLNGPEETKFGKTPDRRCGRTKQTGKQILLCGSLEHHYPPRVFLLGPHWPLSLVVLALIILPNVSIFWSCRGVFMGTFGIAAVGLSSILSYLMLLFGNPGVVVQNLSQEEVWLKYHAQSRLCRRCNSYVPLGSYHCEFCDVCIEDMDHHCPWVGKCVGKYTLSLFYCFLISIVVNIIGIGVFGGVCAVVIRHP